MHYKKCLEKIEEIGKGERKAEELYRTNKTNKGELYCTDETTNKSVEGLNDGSRHRLQILKEAPAISPHPQFTKSWAITEKALDSSKLLLIASYPVRT